MSFSSSHELIFHLPLSPFFFLQFFPTASQVLDDKNVRRRFRASNYQSNTRVKPFICTMPMRLDDGWNQIQVSNRKRGGGRKSKKGQEGKKRKKGECERGQRVGGKKREIKKSC